MDPIYLGHYPESVERVFGSDMPEVTAEDLCLISAPLDACGVNLYDAVRVRAGDDGEPEIVAPKPGAPRTAFNWLVTPEAHEYGPWFLAERYGKPIVITENGLSTRDWVHLDGRVPDLDRIDFLHRHLAALSRAVARGVPVLGYFHWSLLDNFEWNHGYRERFGLVYVDFETGRRVPKASYFAYRDLIAGTRAARSPADPRRNG
jgi:beta-glucosidase